MNKSICLLGIAILVLAAGILFDGRYTQLYAVVYVNQIDPGSLHIVPPYHYERAFDARFQTTERSAVFLDQKIAEVAALYPAPEYIVDGGGWEEEIVYPYAVASGTACVIGLVNVAISFAIPSTLHRDKRKKDNKPSER